MTPQRVVIVGGTHGNEWTGIKIVQHFQDDLRQKFPQLELEFILGNPKAFEANRRFTGEDLNRAFQFLQESRDTFEHSRAKEIKAHIDRSPCFVIDLHTTTSHMGKTIILSHTEALNCHIAQGLVTKIADARVIVSPDPGRKYLASQSPLGMMIEVGAVSNSVVEPKSLEGTLELLEEILRQLVIAPKNFSGVLECYEEIQDIHYPVDDKNQISAYIHSGFQGKDFTLLEGEYVPFKSFQGQEIPMRTDEKLYPIFINEAAYYPQQLAFTLCRKKSLNY